MEKDSGHKLAELKVDGGMSNSALCMQTQADLVSIPIVRPKMRETTALGAAYAAGLATGFWRDTDELRTHWSESRRWEPQWSEEQRAQGYAGWKMAVERTLDWVKVPES